ncbi:uncharacterized protein N7469_002266 [Penicillium citrinum]|uniref:Zn(2)-C6 fungal-type domain-containing protein n=1 Tax=Penicillium citrinum TaxID=5077 RepID=A0A9W9PAB7_PENCI|nr:uncharacterized protein N7469_002266 [Penicillium citrinum]KAJ5240675.1 hypothetical protein N7469_002266 [Penicillium citrinum]
MYNAQPHPRCKNTSARRSATTKAACLPCRQRKIRCQGQVSPCGTCVSRKIEGKCAFPDQETVSVPEQASQVIRNDFNGKMPEEDQTWDTTDNTSTLSDLSSTPSLSVGATDDESEARKARADTIFGQLLQALPSGQMMKDLKGRPPFQPSVTAWKAMVLLIYGRLHRGENVSEDLRLAYNMANTIGCDLCCRQPPECEKHGILWIGLEMLCSMNRQASGNACEHGHSRRNGLWVKTYGKDFVGLPRLRMGYQMLYPAKERFTLLHSKLLELSGFIADSTPDGFLSAWSLLGLLGQMSYIGASIDEFSDELSASDAQPEVGFVQLKILQYWFQYLLLCAYKPFLEKYFSGDTSPHTLFYAAKCVESAQAIRVVFRSLSDNQPCKAFTWYFRVFGREYVAVAERTLKRTNHLRYG